MIRLSVLTCQGWKQTGAALIVPTYEFSQMRQGTPFNALPVLEISGTVVTQSNAICRYIGKMAGLYPIDDLQLLYCDEALDAVEDISHHV